MILNIRTPDHESGHAPAAAGIYQAETPPRRIPHGSGNQIHSCLSRLRTVTGSESFFNRGGAVASSAHYCKYRKPVAIIRNPYLIHTDFADTYPPNPAKIIAYRKNMHGNHRPGLKSSALA